MPVTIRIFLFFALCVKISVSTSFASESETGDSEDFRQRVLNEQHYAAQPNLDLIHKDERPETASSTPPNPPACPALLKSKSTRWEGTGTPPPLYAGIESTPEPIRPSTADSMSPTEDRFATLRANDHAVKLKDIYLPHVFYMSRDTSLNVAACLETVLVEVADDDGESLKAYVRTYILYLQRVQRYEEAIRNNKQPKRRFSLLRRKNSGHHISQTSSETDADTKQHSPTNIDLDELRGRAELMRDVLNKSLLRIVFYTSITQNLVQSSLEAYSDEHPNFGSE